MAKPLRLKRKVVRQNRKGKTTEWETWEINVPVAMARLIPKDTEFAAEFTDDGLLYRVVTPEPEPEPEPLPAWLVP